MKGRDVVTGSSDMLRRLEPTVRPGIVGSSSEMSLVGSLESTSIERLSFGDLIGLMESGRLGVGRPVSVPDGLDLDESDRAALVQAADHAQAAESRRAVVLLGSRSFLLDVAARRIERALAPDPETDWPDVITGVDAVVVQPDSVEGEEAESGVMSRSVFPAVNPLSLLDGPCVVRLNQDEDPSEMNRRTGVSNI